MHDTKTFEKLYGRLNPAQKQAVDTVEGPVMVIAGPGTGKTTVLTLRIANILRVTDSDPDVILALTFTKSGVASMRSKLVEIIGSAAYKVHIHTFHGFCDEVIRRYPESFPRIVGSRNVTEVDQIRILKRIFEENRFTHIKPYGSPYHYLRDALGSIRNLKREGVSVTDFEKLTKRAEKRFEENDDKYYTSGRYEGKLKGAYRDVEKHIERNKELLQVYRVYERELEEDKVYDFEDMVLEVVNRLKRDEDLRLRLQEQFHYILADEHQDANASQNTLLEELASFYDVPNLFIVGDEKQAIFRFQGASLDNFLYFTRRFPDAVIINLTDNYRSYQEILDSAHSLIEHAQIPEGKDQGDKIASLREPLKAFGGSSGERLGILEFGHPDTEYRFVAGDIEKLIEKGVSPGDITVIYRDNKDAFPLAEVLERTEVPFTIESSQNVLEDDDIQKLLSVFRTVDRLDDDIGLSRVLFIDFLGIDHLDAYRMTHMRVKAGQPLAVLMRSDALLKDAGVEDQERIKKLATRMSEWGTYAKHHNFLDVFERIVRESGFLAHVLNQKGSVQKLHKLESLFEEARKAAGGKKDYRLSDFLEHIGLIEEHNVMLKVIEDVMLKNSVHLMTAHRAKGLEFEYVYIIGATDNHWGNRRVSTLFNLPVEALQVVKGSKVDDERRLLYVALTRAKKAVKVSFARENTEGRTLVRSQFLEEIEERFVEVVDTGEIEKEIITKRPGELFAEKHVQGIDVSEKTFLNKLFLDQGLSVTALNSYLRCPWQYFFLNLIRVPQAPSIQQRYGTAIHEALHHFFNSVKKEEDVGEEALLEFFTRSLEKQNVGEVEHEELLEKGVAALSGYYKAHHKTWNTFIFNEFVIKGVLLRAGDTEIRIRGKLDKVEVENGGPCVNVVDYKTGKPRTRNHIEGATKTSNGDYKRQLVFYKLLLDQHEAGRYVMDSGEIDFVEPDTNGKYHRERFDITDADVKLLEGEIQRVASEILELGFWEERCSDTKCKYCALRDMMRNN